MGLKASDSREGGTALFMFALAPLPTPRVLEMGTGDIFMTEGIEELMAELIIEAVEELVADFLVDIGRPCSPLVILLLTMPVGMPDSLDRMDKLAPLGTSDSSSDSSSGVALGT